MPQLLWATDVHLDHVGHPNAAWEFGALVRKTHPESQGLILTGDIAESRTIVATLRHVQEGYEGPVHFVLGNHDYYRAHFRTVDEDVLSMSCRTSGVNWLRETPVILDNETALVGSGGWYDARYGDPESPLSLSDFMLIGEIFEALEESRACMHAVLRDRADALMERLLDQTKHLLASSAIRNVLVATHVPPFAEAAWHDGAGANGTWAPYFASKATGDALLKLAREFPEVNFTVLCGHSHGEGFYVAAANLHVCTGRAKYGMPELAGALHFGDAGGISVTLFPSRKSSPV